MLILLSIGMLTLVFNIQPAKAGTIIVPDHYPTIQAAIDAANPGDTIFVRAGTYYENIVVDKAIALIGENKETTIINGGGRGITISIHSDWVNIARLYITGGSDGGSGGGIVTRKDGFVISHSYITISDCYVGYNQAFGILLRGSHNSISNSKVFGNVRHGIDPGGYNVTIMACEIYENGEYGIIFDDSWNCRLLDCYIWGNSKVGGIQMHDSHDNVVSSCTIQSNKVGVLFAYSALNNLLYHNNFLDNFDQAIDYGSNIWDNGYPSGGNYWSNYIDADLFSGSNQDEPGSDGIWDHPYTIGVVDRYPFTHQDGWKTPPPPPPGVPEFPTGFMLEIALIPIIMYLWWKRKHKPLP